MKLSSPFASMTRFAACASKTRRSNSKSDIFGSMSKPVAFSGFDERYLPFRMACPNSLASVTRPRPRRRARYPSCLSETLTNLPSPSCANAGIVPLTTPPTSFEWGSRVSWNASKRALSWSSGEGSPRNASRALTNRSTKSWWWPVPPSNQMPGVAEPESAEPNSPERNFDFAATPFRRFASEARRSAR